MMSKYNVSPFTTSYPSIGLGSGILSFRLCAGELTAKVIRTAASIAAAVFNLFPIIPILSVSDAGLRPIALQI